jgi:hypothetical protein
MPPWKVLQILGDNYELGHAGAGPAPAPTTCAVVPRTTLYFSLCLFLFVCYSGNM